MIEAMKHYEAALLKAFPKGASGDVFEHWNKARQAIGEAEQNETFEYWNAVEGWVKIDEVRRHFDSVGCGTIYKRPGEGRVPLYLAQPTKAEKQEPVGWIDSKGNMLCVKINESCKPLYTHPQPRKPLTDEQIDEIADTVANMPLVGIVHDFRTRFARAIETAHNIKE